jgi:integrase
MPDGSGSTIVIDDDGPEVLPRDGIHFCKRARSRVLPLRHRRIDIYRFDPDKRQTIPVGTTDTADIEEAEAALKRFCLKNIEAQLAQRKAQGGKSPAIDMLISEVFSQFMLARGEDKTNADAFRGAIKDARRAWPENPHVSEITRSMQEKFVETNRKLKAKPWTPPDEPEPKDEFLETEEPNGSPLRHYMDGTIDSRLALVFAMFRWAHADGRQISVPGKIRDSEWKPVTEATDRDYTNDEIAALLNAAGKPYERSRDVLNRQLRRRRRNDVYWRGMMNYLNFAARAEAGNSMMWAQLDLPNNVVRLNPPGRPLTSKRRPTLPMPPTYKAEVKKWLESDEVHSTYVCTFRGSYRKKHAWFETLKRRAGVTYGTVRTLRKTVRSMMERKGVPGAAADAWCGWLSLSAGASRTSRFYNRAGVGLDRARFLQPCVDALEAWFDELQPLVDYPLGNRQPRGADPMRASLTFSAGLGHGTWDTSKTAGVVVGSDLRRSLRGWQPVIVRGNCVATLSANLLIGKESEAN